MQEKHPWSGFRQQTSLTHPFLAWLNDDVAAAVTLPTMLSPTVLLPLSIAALALVYSGGPSFWLLSLPLTVIITTLAAVALTEQRKPALLVAAVVGLLALLIPVVQFALAD